MTCRHDAVRDRLSSMAKGVGFDVVQEPHFLVRVPGVGGRKPDFVSTKGLGGGRGLLLEVYVVGSSSPVVSLVEVFA